MTRAEYAARVSDLHGIGGQLAMLGRIGGGDSVMPTRESMRTVGAQIQEHARELLKLLGEAPMVGPE